MIKIYAGYEYHLTNKSAERVTRRWGKSQGGEYITVEQIGRRALLRALALVDDLTARLTCADVAGDYCLINRDDMSRLERALG